MQKKFLSSLGACLLLISTFLNAQDRGKLHAVGGYGYYEALFIGFKYEGVKNSRWELGAGYNFNIDNISYHSAYAEYQRAVFLFRNENLETGIAAKFLFWRQSDAYYIWGNLGFIPNIYGQLGLNNKWSTALSLGPQFNFNTYNKNKNYLKTGWVNRVAGNFKISLLYAL